MSSVYMDIGGGHHDSQSMQAPAAFDHLDQPPRETLPSGSPDALKKSPDKATPVVERVSNRLIISNVGIPASGDAVKLVDKQKGRQFVILQVPTGAAAPVLIHHSAQGIEQAPSAQNGWVLTAGANPLIIPTEATIWAATGTNGTATNVQIIVGNLVADGD